MRAASRPPLWLTALFAVAIGVGLGWPVGLIGLSGAAAAVRAAGNGRAGVEQVADAAAAAGWSEVCTLAGAQWLRVDARGQVVERRLQRPSGLRAGAVPHREQAHCLACQFAEAPAGAPFAALPAVARQAVQAGAGRAPALRAWDGPASPPFQPRAPPRAA